jgi:hypothetical protein
LVAAADARCDWFRIAQAVMRFQVQAAAAGQQAPSEHVEMESRWADIKLPGL